METEEPTGYILWDNFNKVTSQIITGIIPIKDDEESLFRAFQALDTEKKGFLLPEELRNYMVTQGEPFTKEEIDEMLAVFLR
jgi:calmodulin